MFDALKVLKKDVKSVKFKKHIYLGFYKNN